MGEKCALTSFLAAPTLYVLELVFWLEFVDPLLGQWGNEGCGNDVLKQFVQARESQLLSF